MFLFGPLPVKSTAHISHVPVVSCLHRTGTLLTVLKMGNASTTQLQYRTTTLLAERKYMGWTFVKLLIFFFLMKGDQVYITTAILCTHWEQNLSKDQKMT